MRIVLLLLSIALVSVAEAAEYVVVVARNSPIEALDSERLRDIFLRRRSFEGGIPLVPINLLGEEAVRTQFESLVLQMDRGQINQYWVTSHFQGIKPPATQASLQSIKTFIERVDGAIGYLPVSMVDDGLKVLHEF
jgi:hypothetical protein